jgi:hypothetical protein
MKIKSILNFIFCLAIAIFGSTAMAQNTTVDVSNGVVEIRAGDGPFWTGADIDLMNLRATVSINFGSSYRLSLSTEQIANLFNTIMSGDCTRHFYNNSDLPVQFKLEHLSKGLNVYVNPTAENQLLKCLDNSCLVSPHSTVAMHFKADSFGITSGRLTFGYPLDFRDVNPKLNSQMHGVASFTFDQDASRCPYLNHNGKTAHINLNQPANGDVQVFENMYVPPIADGRVPNSNGDMTTFISSKGQQWIAIRTPSGKYLSASNAKDGSLANIFNMPVVTFKKSVGPDETFYFERAVKGFNLTNIKASAAYFAVRTLSGHYLAPVNGGGMTGPSENVAPIYLRTNGEAATNPVTRALEFSAFDKFLITPHKNTGTFTIQRADGDYLSVPHGGGFGDAKNLYPIHTDSYAQGDWEKLQLVETDTWSVQRN